MVFKREIVPVLVIIFLSFLPSSTAANGNENAVHPIDHKPIRIDGIGDLNSTHGVVSGSGTIDDPYIIENWLFNCTLEAGIEIENSSAHITISSCILYGSIFQRESGMVISNSSNVQIFDCYSIYCERGVLMANSSDILIGSSVFLGSDNGIDVIDSRDLEIISTICSYNVLNGISLENCSRIMIEDYLTEHNNAILGGSNGLLLRDSTDVMINNSEFNLCYGSGAMLLSDMDKDIDHGIMISNCSFDNDHNGILMDGLNGVVIQDCSFGHNSYSVYISQSTGISITDSKAYRNDYGIYIQDSRNGAIKDNLFDMNDRDIVLDGSSHCTISRNRFKNTSQISLSVGTFSSIDISSGNVIYYNHFLSGSPRERHARDHGTANTWSHDEKGNLWMGGGSPDEDLNGIGDIPYDINGDGSVTDPYPIAHDLLVVDEDFSDGNDVEPHSSDLVLLMAGALLAVLIISAIILLMRSRDH